MTTSSMIEDVPLAQYAAVKAGIAEGFALHDVLAIEGLGAHTWKEADAAWKVKLGCEPSALASYESELANAEDTYSRRVSPLEDDPGAWVAFLHAFTRSPEPFALLEANRLGMNDVSRLRRRWARRIEEESALAKKLAKLSSAPGTLPRIEVEPAKLRRSRVAEAARSVSSVDQPRAPVAVRSALDAHRDMLRALAAKRAQAEAEASQQPSPVAVAAAVLPEPMVLPLGMCAILDVHGTQLAPEAPPTGPVLPFDPQATPQLAQLGEAPAGMPNPIRAVAAVSTQDDQIALPPGMRAFLDVHGTQLAPNAPPRPALPFAADARTKAPSAIAIAHAPELKPEPPTIPEPARPEPPLGLPGFVDVHGTQEVTNGPAAGSVLPFEPAALPQPNVVPLGLRHVVGPTGTIPAAPIPAALTPKRTTQPSLAIAPTARIDMPPGLPKGMLGFLDVEGTRAAVDTPVEQALPFVPAKGNAPTPNMAVPRITLEEYARMCVELAVHPARKLDILRKYGVDDAERCRIDDYWSARIREEKSMRAAWDRHYMAHWARLNRR